MPHHSDKQTIVAEIHRSFDIYRITNEIIQKSYIGLTTAGIEQRWIEHRAYAKRGAEKSHPLYEDMIDFGIDCFSVTHIACCKNLRDLKQIEKQLITQENTLTPFGYNLSSGGEGGFVTSAKGIEYSGIFYQTHKSLSDAYKVDYGVFMYRLKSDWSIGEALGIEAPPTKDPNAIEVNLPIGTFNSISQAAEHLGIEKDTVYGRLRHGKSIEQAFGFEPTFHPLYRQVQVEGTNYPSVKAATEAYNLPYSLVKDRMRDRGIAWSLEQALEFEPAPPRKPPPRWNDKSVIAFGEKFSSQVAFARKYGVKEQLVYARLKKGYSPEESVLLPVLKGQSPEGVPNSANKPIYLVGNENIVYQSAAKMALDVGSTTTTIKTFLRNGWPIFGQLFAYSSEMKEPVRKKLPRLCDCVIRLEDKSIFNSPSHASKELKRSPEGIQQHCKGKYKNQDFVYVCDYLRVTH